MDDCRKYRLEFFFRINKNDNECIIYSAQGVEENSTKLEGFFPFYLSM